MKDLPLSIQNNAIAPASAAGDFYNGRWFSIFCRADRTEADISIMDQIGGWGITAQEFLSQLKGLKPDAVINLKIFSSGGDVFEGNEIYNGLKLHKGPVNVTIGAFCASIATVIACAGKTIKMASNGWYMIHNPWVFAIGDSADLRKKAEIMDGMKDTIVGVFAARSGLAKEKISELMDDESWFNAEKAKELNFIDSIVEIENQDEEKVRNCLLSKSQFRNCPIQFQQQSANGGTPPLPSGNATASSLPAEGKPTPKGRSSAAAKPQQQNSIVHKYMTGKLRIFNSALVGSILAAAPSVFFPPDDGGTTITGGASTSAGGDPGGGDPEIDTKIKQAARQLFLAKVKRDKEIDDVVLSVRNRDKKDFGELAATFKQEDKTAAEFALAISGSDQFKPFNVVGSGIEVVGVQGMQNGTPGELFVSSDEYKGLIDRVRKGSRTRSSVLVETAGFIAAAMARFLNVGTSSGLTSIEKLPGVVTLGVRPLTVKDLIAPGSTNNTTIRYIQEQSITIAATAVAEGAAKPAASFTLVETDATVKKIAAYTKVTDELFMDFLAVASYINMRLPYMVQRIEEDQLLNGDGTGANLTGILATAGLLAQAKGGDTAIDAIYKAITKVRWGNNIAAAAMTSAQGGFEPDGVIIHPTDWEAIRLLKDGNDQYYGGGPFTSAYGNGGQMVDFEMLWRKPVVITPAIAQGTALMGAFRLGSQYFQRQGMTIESTNTDQDDFIKNLTTIRAEIRLALAVYRPSAFCQVTGL